MTPYNLGVLATYEGRLESESMLPSSGNELGDTWIVGETPWVCGSGLPAQLRPFEKSFRDVFRKSLPIFLYLDRRTYKSKAKT